MAARSLNKIVTNQLLIICYENLLQLNYKIINLWMSRLIKGMFKWSLEITGASIVWYNYQNYERQQKIMGVYHFLCNSYRTALCLYNIHGLYSSQFTNAYEVGSQDYTQKLKEFRSKAAIRIQQLCAVNKGVYARMGQLLAGMTDIMPSEVIKELKKLQVVNAQDEVPYNDVKIAIQQSLGKSMKQIFDAFVTKPLKVGLFTQTYKACLLQNYRQTVIKVLLPARVFECQHDLWFINKCMDYVSDYLTKDKVNPENIALLKTALQQSQQLVRDELNFDKELQYAQQNKQLVYQNNSAFYVPTYYPKYCNKNVLIRQYIEGVPINDIKGLKQLGLTPQIAFAYVLSQVHHQLKKSNLISGALHGDNILIRKYIRPVKPVLPTGQVIAHPQVDQKKQQKKSNNKKIDIIHPPFQVIFLAQNNYQSVPNEVKESFTSYWSQLKKQKQRTLPSVFNFYTRLSNYQNFKQYPLDLLQKKFYLYEPLLRLYEQIVKLKQEKVGAVAK